MIGKGVSRMPQYKCDSCGTTATTPTQCCGAPMAAMKRAVPKKAAKPTAKRAAKA
jgi:hypothetical protein